MRQNEANIEQAAHNPAQQCTIGIDDLERLKHNQLLSIRRAAVEQNEANVDGAVHNFAQPCTSYVAG